LILNSEQTILGAILLRSEILPRVKQRVKATDFMSEKNCHIYKAICKLVKDGHVPEPASLVGVLGDTYEADIISLVADIHTSVGWEYHAEQMVEAATRRNLLELADMIRGGIESRSTSSEILSDIKKRVTKLSDTGGKATESIVDLLPGVVESLEKGSVRPGVGSGFYDIDRITGGWQNGELIIIAGRPGMGKSLLAKDFAEAAKVPTLIFSLEMSKAELIKRQLSGASRVDFESIRTSNVADSDWDSISRAANKLSDLPIYYNDSGRLTIDQLCAIAETKKLTKGIGLVIIDYLQLIRSVEKADQREREVANLSRELKTLARTLDIPVICLAQLNRECEKRVPPRPRLFDLRESGAIEQDADIVGFLFRPWVYNRDADQHEAHFIIAKSRNTRTGTIKLVFDGSIQRFDSAVRGNDYE
jgi:replicative DNA helicase